MKTYLRRIWSRLLATFAPPACESCGAAAVGFHAAVAGKLLAKDAGGKPVTKYYLGPPRRMCAACLRAAEGQGAAGSSSTS